MKNSNETAVSYFHLHSSKVSQEKLHKMDTAVCGCKGIRTCALCKNSDRATKLQKSKMNFLDYETYVYVCPTSKMALKIHPIDTDSPFSMEMIFQIQQNLIDELSRGDNEKLVQRDQLYCDNIILIHDFLSESEEDELVAKIDSSPWQLSQSGRRKQDYGPKVNFKQRKLRLDHYLGMPSYSKALLDKMAASCMNNALSNYIPFELCNLEYDPQRRACIDFHIDDTWIWGERLISINLLAGSVMTLVYEKGDKKRLLYIPMPRRSLLCMAGPMRYEWTHGVFPEHIENRRIALTMREPSKIFQPDGELYEKWGHTLIDRAKCLVDISLTNERIQ